jgi:AAHS family benzoate transporter-like MFS transporter
VPTIGSKYYNLSSYPANIRSTALGMASGIGRIGGMLGPILGGFLLSITLPIHMNFIAFAIPGLIAIVRAVKHAVAVK